MFPHLTPNEIAHYFGSAVGAGVGAFLGVLRFLRFLRELRAVDEAQQVQLADSAEKLKDFEARISALENKGVK